MRDPDTLAADLWPDTTPEMDDIAPEPGGAAPAITDPADDVEARRAADARAVEAMRASRMLSPVPNPFAALTPEEAAAGTAEGEASDVWEPMMPAPRPLPALPDMPKWKGAAASACWAYRDPDGRTLCAVVRFEVERDGRREKETVPYTYGRRVWTDKKGERRDLTTWHFKRPTGPLPLFGLGRLASAPDASVLVVEGEKTAEAAQRLFPEWVVVTSIGGAQAAGKAGWAPLAGRRVVIWPDHDTVGEQYAADVARLATEAGADSVGVVEVPGEWPDGFDLADEHPTIPDDDVARETYRAMIEAAQPAGPGLELPPGFRFSRGGLFFYPEGKVGEAPPPPVFVMGSAEVVGECDDGTGAECGLVLRWKDKLGRSHQRSIPKRLAHEDGSAIPSRLEDEGLHCGVRSQAHQLLREFVARTHSSRHLQCVSRGGWHNPKGKHAFLLAEEAFGPGRRDVVLQNDAVAGDKAYRAQGTLAEWQEHVARYAVGNDRLALFLCAAFAGTLLDVVGEPSGGVHLVGGSQTGKTTAARVAASVWGRADSSAQLLTWRATANGIEGLAARASDGLLTLDELGQANPNEVSATVYMIGNERGKARAGRDGGAGKAQTWRVLLLSTGEVSLETKLAEENKRAMAGQAVRFPSLPADAGAGMGVFQELHGFDSARKLADHLRETTRTYYGTACRAFLTKLAAGRAENPEGLADCLRERVEGFLAAHLPPGADGQVSSVARRFGLIAAAGALAQSCGVLPWRQGEAERAVGACFRAWLDQRGCVGAAEERQAVEQVRAFLEAHGASRFETIILENQTAGDTRIINRAGFKKRRDGDEWEFLILPEAWKGEVCAGSDSGRVARVLAEREFLRTSKEGGRTRYQVPVRLPGIGLARVYVVSAAILTGESEGASDGV